MWRLCVVISCICGSGDTLCKTCSWGTGRGKEGGSYLFPAMRNILRFLSLCPLQHKESKQTYFLLNPLDSLLLLRSTLNDKFLPPLPPAYEGLQCEHLFLYCDAIYETPPPTAKRGQAAVVTFFFQIARCFIRPACGSADLKNYSESLFPFY